jgi:hypothetical protein
MRRVVLVCSLLVLAVVAGCAQATVGGIADAGVDGSPVEIDAPPPVDAIDAPTCVRQPCDIYAQCGCEATPGQVCDLDSTMLATGATACREDLLHGTETLACTRNSSCAALHSCIGGRCRKYCEADDDCASPGGLCVIEPTFNGQPIPGVRNCSSDCVPTLASNSNCPAGWGCHVYRHDPTPTTPMSGDERWLTDCAAPPATGGGVAAPCTSHNSCQPGLDCVTLNPGGQQCRPSCMCPAGNCAAGSCPVGSGSCRAFNPPVLIGTVTYGTCF